MQWEKIKELERVLCTHNINIYDHHSSSDADEDKEEEEEEEGQRESHNHHNNDDESRKHGDERDDEGGRSGAADKEQLVRIQELESSLLESDNEVFALQQLLLDKENEKQKEIQDILNLHSSSNLFNCSSQSSLAVDLKQIYPDKTAEPFGEFNPLGGDNISGDDGDQNSSG